MFATDYKPQKRNKNVIRINYKFRDFIGSDDKNVRISESNTKMGPIPSFNTLPSNLTYKFDDLTILGTCAQTCTGCYGMKGNYDFSESLNAEALNTLLIRDNMAAVFAQIKSYCMWRRPRVFRIHSNGDLLNFEEFQNWIETAKQCPDTVFYCYTKMYEWIDAAFSLLDMPKNFIINISVFDGYGEKIARGIFEKYPENTNIFIAEIEHRQKFDGMNKKVCKCPAYQRTILKSGKMGAVKLMHDKNDPFKYTCLWCGICQRPGQIISTLIH